MKVKPKASRPRQVSLIPNSKKKYTLKSKSIQIFGEHPVGATVDIKPLSVNEAWKGRRFKSEAYNIFQKKMLYMLPAMTLPMPPYKVTFEFGFSNKLSDFDNPVKLTCDCLVKKYGVDDREIYEAVIRKKIVEKGKEYISFVIETLVK